MLKVILTLLFAHFFSDFIIQPEKISANKWHSTKALLQHVLLYTMGLFLFAWWLLVPPGDWWALQCFLVWALVNGIFHYFIRRSRRVNTPPLWGGLNYNAYIRIILEKTNILFVFSNTSLYL